MNTYRVCLKIPNFTTGNIYYGTCLCRYRIDHGSDLAQLADGSIITCDVVGPVEVRFANREYTCRAIILPGDAEPLLGLIPMEDMDVIIHPQRQGLVVHPDHPFFAYTKLKKLFARVA